MRYRFELVTPDGTPIAEWTMTSYGKTPTAMLQSDQQAVNLAAVMALRYVVRMVRRPGQRWFGGAIPIVFHLVLASFLFTWGRFHAQR